jgi:hypothetical protein
MPKDFEVSIGPCVFAACIDSVYRLKVAEPKVAEPKVAEPEGCRSKVAEANIYF